MPVLRLLCLGGERLEWGRDAFAETESMVIRLNQAWLSCEKWSTPQATPQGQVHRGVT